MQPLDILFVLIILIFSTIVHEVMHGVAAEWLGDKTARYAGRITLNPLPHIDPVGSVFLPLLLAFTHSPVWFAWAKPVPYNPYNLRSDGIFARWNEAIVAAAGPCSNIAIAVVCGGIIRMGIIGQAGIDILSLVVMVNVMLTTFNLIPLPPLDGSKVLYALLPRSIAYTYGKWRTTLDMNPALGMLIILFVVMGLGSYYNSLVDFLVRLLIGT